MRLQLYTDHDDAAAPTSEHPPAPTSENAQTPCGRACSNCPLAKLCAHNPDAKRDDPPLRRAA
ncbi:MAG: hypothetical protein AAF432_09785 [Planctomycetota bacterium]